MNILEALFDSKVKLRLLKLFLRNPQEKFLARVLPKKIQADSRKVRRELELLKKAKFLNKRNRHYLLNQKFEFYSELKNLILKSTPASKDKIINGVRKLSGIKLVVVSGTLLNCENCRTDLLIVARNLNRQKFNKFLASLEAEVGKEINYTLMTIEEFNYRHDMFDRFIRSILEGPHEIVINKLRI